IHVSVLTSLPPIDPMSHNGKSNYHYSFILATSSFFSTLHSSALVSLFGLSTFTLSLGTFSSFFSASLLPSTTLSPGIVSLEPSWYVTVTCLFSPSVILFPSVLFDLDSLSLFLYSNFYTLYLLTSS